MYGTKVSCIIDTGINLNIISSSTFNRIKHKTKIDCSTIKAYVFNANSPIPFLGEFMVTLRCSVKTARAKILVLDGNEDNLLGYATARKLGLVTIRNTEVDHILRLNTFDPTKMYPSLFEDKIGLLKGVEIEIVIDSSIKPKQIPPYPIPFHLQALTKAKLDSMEANGVIERAHGKLTWISPLHVVPKIDSVTKEIKDVRITANNKALNKAIKLEKRYMPSIRDLTYELNGMTVFSKVDIRDAFNQILLSEKSKILTAFSTQWGTYWYSRLNMGLAIASELFQQIMTEKLKHIPNQRLATDDIIIYGRNMSETTHYLKMVLDQLNNMGVTLNKKCEFLKPEITFYGHRISADGIVPLEHKMQDFL